MLVLLFQFSLPEAMRVDISEKSTMFEQVEMFFQNLKRSHAHKRCSVKCRVEKRKIEITVKRRERLKIR